MGGKLLARREMTRLSLRGPRALSATGSTNRESAVVALPTMLEAFVVKTFPGRQELQAKKVRL